MACDHVPFLSVDDAKAELGIPYHVRLRPTAIDCTRCGQKARAAAGDHICLWCRVSEQRDYRVYPCRARYDHASPTVPVSQPQTTPAGSADDRCGLEPARRTFPAAAAALIITGAVLIIIRRRGR